MYSKFFKRAIDITISLILLPFVVVIGVVVAIFIWAEDRGSVFYLAPRRGKYGKIFKMYKFRSMKMNAPDIRNADNSTYNAPDDPRITKVGKILRKTSVDELPQLLNVLTGDMSLIGPRPITVNKPLSDYDEKRRVRLEVKPGITGYSQAYFRNSITSEEKLEKDAWYAKNVSFAMDLKIFFATIRSVLFRSNIYNNSNE
ncbi:sugar transferase [Bacteroides caecimuris]|jgi:lipopolysaccharide/colanic/teichoic acid biosynthesis glycosyltransferase|uniref:sugar transferase n=1 Tax=Bacteroides caecimuris TaxID=1796613 RepID=UPI002570226B|nr:sugar transferase [Bacteroides caecimuris]